MLEAVGVTFGRIWGMVLIAILVSIVLGILAARVKAAESIIITVTDILEAVPVISFFPVILIFFLERLPPGLGIEVSVDFLILSAVLWNILLGVYEAVSHIPPEYHDIMTVYRMNLWQKLRTAYVPAAVPKIISNIPPSFSSALFYVTLSEVISIGNRQYSVFGIGSLSIHFAQNGDLLLTWILILFVVVAIALNYYFIIDPLLKRTDRYSFDMEPSKNITGSRRPGVFIRSVSQFGSQLAVSGRRFVGKISNAVSITSGEKSDTGKPALSARSANIITGAILLAAIFAAIYYVVISGFGSAFTQYILNFEQIVLFSYNIGFDFLRIAVVYILIFFTMVPLAIYLGSRRRRSKNSVAVMQILYSIPIPIFVPILMTSLFPSLSFVAGYGIAMNIVVVLVAYLSSAAYVFFNVYGAVLNIPDDLNMVTSVYKFSWRNRIRHVVLPAIFPSLVTGSMAAVGGMWGGLIVSEFTVVNGKSYAVSSGLMKMLDEALFQGGHAGLIYSDAIDIFLVIIIIVMSLAFWYRLYTYSKKYTF